MAVRLAQRGPERRLQVCRNYSGTVVQHDAHDGAQGTRRSASGLSLMLVTCAPSPRPAHELFALDEPV